MLQTASAFGYASTRPAEHVLRFANEIPPAISSPVNCARILVPSATGHHRGNAPGESWALERLRVQPASLFSPLRASLRTQARLSASLDSKTGRAAAAPSFAKAFTT